MAPVGGSAVNVGGDGGDAVTAVGGGDGAGQATGDGGAGGTTGLAGFLAACSRRYAARISATLGAGARAMTDSASKQARTLAQQTYSSYPVHMFADCGQTLCNNAQV